MSEATIDYLNSLLAPHDAHISKHLTCDVRGHALIVWWEMTSTSATQFTVGYKATFKEVASVLEQHILECEAMNIFSTKLFPYLQGDMLKDAGSVILTMKHVEMVKLTNSQGSEDKPVLYFKERDKGMVLNKTNAKAIAKLYGPETEDWNGEKIVIYAQAGVWFGKAGHTIVVSDEKPKKKRANRKPVEQKPDKPSLTDAQAEELQSELFD